MRPQFVGAAEGLIKKYLKKFLFRRFYWQN